MIQWIPPEKRTTAQSHPSAQHNADTEDLVRRLHNLAIEGPGNSEIAWAMRLRGYDQVAWAEGQRLLAELVGNGPPAASALPAAIKWYDQAASAAHRALADQPHLLARLGLHGTRR